MQVSKGLVPLIKQLTCHFGFDQELLDAVIKAGYTEPSAIQRQAIPVALEGRDIIGIAKTGSGKSSGNGFGRLVCHHVEPTGTCMPECILQIYPFQSAEVASQRILVYHSGVVARKLNGSQQAGVY